MERDSGRFLCLPPPGGSPARLSTAKKATYFKEVRVTFDDVVGTDIEVVDDSTVLVTVPNLSPGPADITVTTAGGSATIPGESDGFVVK